MVNGTEYQGLRADVCLSQVAGITRSAAEKIITDGGFSVNGTPVGKNYRIKAEDCIEYKIPEPEKSEVEAQEIPLDIIYEDEYLIIVNKPQGMVVHPAPGNPDNTLVNALLAHCGESLSGINGVIRPGIVHRIDKNTSGLLMVAKTNEAHLALAEQIKEHSFFRQYKGIIVGHFKESRGVIDAPIGRNPKDRKKMAVTLFNSKQAITEYETVEEYSGYSLVNFRLKTGRTHQIRVHSAYLGHPILGDDLYSNTEKESVRYGLKGQCLHAEKLGLLHPFTGKYMEFKCEPPEYFVQLINKLK